MQTLERKITWKEFKEMEIPEGDLSIYELINGEIVKRASPNTLHQATSGKLFFELESYNRKKKAGHIFTAPYDVYFDEETAGVQPDILFVSNERDFIIEKDNGIVGAPDLIIEIISKGSIDKDRVIKKKVCQRFAVKEYWIVDPNNTSIEVYVMQNDVYELGSFAAEEGKITSTVLSDLELEVSAIFE